MSRLVRKSSEEGNAVARSTSGSGGGGEACFFLLNVFDAKDGIDGIAGTSSLSIEGRRLVPALCPPSNLFLERKRFIVRDVSDALVHDGPQIQPIATGVQESKQLYDGG